MSEPFFTTGRILALLITPTLILLPLVIAMFVPNRVTDEVERRRVREKLLVLVMATVLSLALWGGLVLAGLRFPAAFMAAIFSWPLFFPLWFGLAWPLMSLKNPTWKGTMHGSAEAPGAVRTASLTNRVRQSPVTRWMWVAAVIACSAGPIAIALRGLQLFAVDSTGGEAATANSPEYQRWLILLLISATMPINLLAVPGVLRSMLMESEPMDAAGSPELSELYARQRRRRALGMFWLMGVLGPASLGAIFALMVWFPNLGSMWGLIGGLGGVLVGCIGSVFGFMMTAERAKIAEVRARLNAERSAAGSQPTEVA